MSDPDALGCILSTGRWCCAKWGLQRADLSDLRSSRLEISRRYADSVGEPQWWQSNQVKIVSGFGEFC